MSEKVLILGSGGTLYGANLVYSLEQIEEECKSRGATIVKVAGVSVNAAQGYLVAQGRTKDIRPFWEKVKQKGTGFFMRPNWEGFALLALRSILWVIEIGRAHV